MKIKSLKLYPVTVERPPFLTEERRAELSKQEPLIID